MRVLLGVSKDKWCSGPQEKGLGSLAMPWVKGQGRAHLVICVGGGEGLDETGKDQQADLEDRLMEVIQAKQKKKKN